MSWVARFDLGPLDGAEWIIDDSPPPEIAVCHPADIVERGLTVTSSLIGTALQSPGRVARYRLQMGVFPGPLRYRLTDDGPFEVVPGGAGCGS